MKKRIQSKNFVIFVLILFLLLSGLGHVKNLDDERKYNNELLKSYLFEIQRAASSMEEALAQEEGINADYVNISLTALEVAGQTAANLGTHSEKYTLSKAEVYAAVPWELRALIGQAKQSDIQRSELESIAEVLSIYSRTINMENLVEPDRYLQTYRDIHQKIHNEKILDEEKDLSLRRIIG